MSRIYLDHNATTPLDPEVLETMVSVMKTDFGNPSSIHYEGRAAREFLDIARQKVADLIRASSSEIIFTSGGTEANNFSLLGAALSARGRAGRIISTQVEHASIINPLKQLEKDYDIVLLGVDSNGKIDPDELEASLTDDTLLVSIQYVNSETGIIQDIAEISERVRSRGILFHTDAVQAAGKIDLDFKNLPVDMASFSAHKLYGPKGVGALYLRKGTPPLFSPLCGGGQERKRRGGTENVSGIAGFGKACEIARNFLREGGSRRIAERGEYFLKALKDSIPDVSLIGEGVEKLGNTFNIVFDGVEGDTLLIGLDMAGISVSAGSACSSGSGLPSPTLLAMGLPVDSVNSSLRFSLGKGTTQEDLDKVVRVLQELTLMNRKPPPVFN
ncbi:MAG: cysteine desulfurase [Candidatus Nitrohelix vancouverensis]|uniref:cysteine desulfurase n=1 Tax=Candidatus Nitrohelix vancouverensis TaxID=2705534 RepID=A0A7T0C3Q3_9BACT|nr:MAG: cysteine desulfurase [Candidatus Nitrohelix vancouverensis]